MISAGALPQTQLGSLQRSSRPPSWILRGPTSKGGDGKERGGEREDGERKGQMGDGEGKGREREEEGKRPPPQKNLATGRNTVKTAFDRSMTASYNTSNRKNVR